MDREPGVDRHDVNPIAPASRSPDAVPPLHVRDEHAAGRVSLCRPAQRNALTPAMYRALVEPFAAWVRAPITYCVLLESRVAGVFSTGMDLDLLRRDCARTDPAGAHRALADAYALVWQLDCFTKPTVSFIDGVVAGGGVGISLFGTHRVAGDTYSFAMPEVGAGWFPDHGVAHALARLPRQIGMYLALSGRTLGAADAFHLGLATHVIPSARFAAIAARLCDADPVDPLLDDLNLDPGPGELEPYGETIERCFSGQTVEDILARLRGVTGKHADWAAEVVRDLTQKSPLALKLAHRLLREAGGRDLRQVLQLDYRVACRRLEAPDFGAGGTGAQPRLEDIDAAEVDRHFLPLAGGELALKTRAEMQAVTP